MKSSTAASMYRASRECGGDPLSPGVASNPYVDWGLEPARPRRASSLVLLITRFAFMRECLRGVGLGVYKLSNVSFFRRKDFLLVPPRSDPGHCNVHVARVCPEVVMRGAGKHRDYACVYSERRDGVWLAPCCRFAILLVPPTGGNREAQKHVQLRFGGTEPLGVKVLEAWD